VPTELPLPSPLLGARVKLEPLAPNDYEFLYSLATSSSHPYRWRFRAFVPRIEQFVDGLWTDVLAQFVISSRDGTKVGHVVAYGGDLRNANVGLAVIVRDDLVGSGAGVEAGYLMIRYLFESWNLEKVYMDVPEFNMDFLGAGTDRYFTEEGVRRRHIYYAGTYYDLHHLAIFRDEFNQYRTRVDALLASLGQRLNGHSNT
jgi:RimJ/RimL family protein N-acetyltransferase